MIKSLHTAATGMKAQQTNMDVTANNLANVSTTGFKKSRAEFEDLLYQNVKDPGTATGLNSVTPTGVQVGLGVKTGAISKDFSLGSVKITNNDLDMQIEGRGFFQILQNDGEIAYTRNGEFKRTSEGKVVDHNGHPIIPELTIPTGTLQVKIKPNGDVFAITKDPEPQQIGKVELATFVNPVGLKAVGRNLFISTPGSGEANVGNPGDEPIGYVSQGQLEMSNVNIVEEMVNMITTQRAYETNSKVIQASDQMLQAVTNLR